MATKTPKKISLRVYPVGFGDCFLLGFHYGAGDERFVLIDFGSTELTRKRVPRSKEFLGYMKKVADDIAVRCGRTNGKGGQLHAVVATHRHADHINGFATKAKPDALDASGDVIRSLQPRFVVQPWTEDPDLAPKALGPAEAAKVGGARGFAALLNGMQSTAVGIVKEAARLTAKRMAGPGGADDGTTSTPEAVSTRRAQRVAFVRQIGFLGEDNIANISAVRNLMIMGKAKGAKALYLHADAKANLGLPGVKTHVLGPPTLKQSDAVKKMRSVDEVEFWMLLGATATRFTASGVAPFTAPGCVEGARVPDHARWLRDHIRAARAETLLGIVRSLDKQMNNTSLILVFEVGGARLLFPGDAQLENWQYALANAAYRKLLATTTLYKVGHHGSRNATPKEGLWKHFAKRSTKKDAADRMWSIVSTMANKHGTTEATKVPRKTLMDALKHDTNYRTTQDFERAELDWRDFAIDPRTGWVTEVERSKAPRGKQTHKPRR
ncbi:MAG: LactamaseB domain-containing protein [Nitrospira sp.]|nr:MAG: LactamaseB domain-containing protein [Nitrospira sp.]